LSLSEDAVQNPDSVESGQAVSTDTNTKEIRPANPVFSYSLSVARVARRAGSVKWLKVVEKPIWKRLAAKNKNGQLSTLPHFSPAQILDAALQIS